MQLFYKKKRLLFMNFKAKITLLLILTNITFIEVFGQNLLIFG